MNTQRILFSTLVLLALFGCNQPSPATTPDSAVEQRLMGDRGTIRVKDLGVVIDQSVGGTLEEYFQQTFGLALTNVYWGEFHAHTAYSADAAACVLLSQEKTYGPEDAYTYARDVEQLDFVGLSDHAEEPNPTAIADPYQKLGLNNWESLAPINAQFNNEDTKKGKVFIVFAGWEYTNTHGIQPSMGSSTGYGHKNVVFKEIGKTKLPTQRVGALAALPDEQYAVDNPGLWAKLGTAFRPACADCEGTGLTIVHTPANIGEGGSSGGPEDHRTDWNTMDKDYVRHVEISSKWGSSEGPAPVGAGCATDVPYLYTPDPEADPLAVRPLLYDRWVKEGNAAFLLGFVGGTDNHAGRPANDTLGQCGMGEHGALTGIVAPTLTRSALWTHLWKRHTLACTTGMRVPVLLSVEAGGTSLLMGEVGPHAGSARVRVLADQTVNKIELIVDGCIHETVVDHRLDLTLTLAEGRHFIYARAWAVLSANDLRPVWTSPVYLGPALK